jgi:uncharacterized protein YegP (UPF0339 family)
MSRHFYHLPVTSIALAIVLFCSCRDIIEPSITNRQVQLRAPAESYQSTSYTLNFWWNEVEDALKYHLQVVSGTFDAPNSLVLDTIIKGNKFVSTFTPGSYQWRVRAENGSTQTAYALARSFEVVFSSLKQQKPQIGSPVNNFLTNQGSVMLGWNAIYGATKYHLQIDSNNFADESQLVYDQMTPAQQFKYVLGKDANYQWRVRAENDTAQSQWSSVNYFTYDHTPPAKPVLSAPANNTNISLPIALSWGQVSTAVRYKLYVYKSDSTTPFSSSFPMTLTTNNYSFNQGTLSDQVYWRVTALDAAGNESQVSELRSFTIQ